MDTYEAAEILAQMCRKERKWNDRTHIDKAKKIEALEIAIQCIVGEFRPEDATQIRALAQMDGG